MPMKRKPRKARRPRRGNTKPFRKATLLTAPKVYPFKRQTEVMLDMSNPSPAGWTQTLDNQVVKTFSFNLNDLPNHTEFQALFNQYKLNYAIIEMFPNVSTMVGGYTQPGSSGSNYIVHVWRNTHGVPLNAAFTREDLLEIQNKKTFMMPMTKPTRS